MITTKMTVCPRCRHSYSSEYHKWYCGKERTDSIPLQFEASADFYAESTDATIYGSDWSHWNTVNVAKAAQSGIQFCYIKASEGNYMMDDKRKMYYQACKEHGIKVSFYHYFKCNKDGRSQAEYMKRAIGSMDPDMPIALDCEDTIAPGYNKRDTAKKIYHFAKTMQGFDGWPEIMIYTRASWWDAYVANIYQWHKTSLWVAHWGAGGKPNVPKPWKNVGWTIHQYGTRSIGGARVDANKWNPAVPFPPGGGVEPPPPPPEPPEPPPLPTLPDEFDIKGSVDIGDAEYKISALFQKEE